MSDTPDEEERFDELIAEEIAEEAALTAQENDLVKTAVETLRSLPKEEYGPVLIIAAALYPEAIIRAMEIRADSHG